MAKTTAQPRTRDDDIHRLQQANLAARGRMRELQAKYDAAQTTTDNSRLWVNADALAAASANRPEVRRTLRNRCRYEVANNSIAKGIVWTIAGDTVGTGPTLQLSVEGADKLNSFVESDFALWAREIKLAEKLRIMRAARPSDGEIFAVFVTNPGLRHPVKVDIQLFEAEQVADVGMNSIMDAQWDDGIHYDAYGNPISYRRLKQHPGYMGAFTGPTPFDFDDLPAEYVWHYQKIERAGQRRAIPELTPAVQLFNDLRRYRAAVLSAAETAARLAVLIHTKAPPDTGAAEDQAAGADPMDVFDLPRSGGLVLPDGYDATQMKAEQPTTTYDSFTRALLAEIARCLNVPYSIAALDSSQANQSARYMDAEFYVRDRKIDRHDFECFLDRVLDVWLTEARLIPNYLPADAESYPHDWHWPALAKHADPDKVASAKAQNLKNGLSSLPRELADDGKDWEKEIKLAARAYGITVPEFQALLRQSIFGALPAPAPADDKADKQDPPPQK